MIEKKKNPARGASDTKSILSLSLVREKPPKGGCKWHGPTLAFGFSWQSMGSSALKGTNCDPAYWYKVSLRQVTSAEHGIAFFPGQIRVNIVTLRGKNRSDCPLNPVFLVRAQLG